MKNRQVRRPIRAPINPSYTPLYREQRQPVKSRQWRVMPLLSAALIVAVVITLISILRLGRVEVVGGSNTVAIKQGTEQWLKERPQWLFGVEERAIKSFIEQTYTADVESATIGTRWWQRQLVVNITPRSARLLWQSGGRHYLLDHEGIVLSEGKEKLPKVRDLTDLPLKSGDKAVPNQFVTFVTGLSTGFTKQTGLKLKAMQIEETTREVVVVTINFNVRFDTSQDLNGQLESVNRVLKVAKRKGSLPSSYIDVRIPYKAYYR